MTEKPAQVALTVLELYWWSELQPVAVSKSNLLLSRTTASKHWLEPGRRAVARVFVQRMLRSDMMAGIEN